jgi:hypothetical protein
MHNEQGRGGISRFLRLSPTSKTTTQFDEFLNFAFRWTVTSELLGHGSDVSDINEGFRESNDLTEHESSELEYYPRQDPHLVANVIYTFNRGSL